MTELEERLLAQIEGNDQKTNDFLNTLTTRINKCFSFVEELSAKQEEHSQKL